MASERRDHRRTAASRSRSASRSAPRSDDRHRRGHDRHHRSRSRSRSSSRRRRSRSRSRDSRHRREREEEEEENDPKTVAAAEAAEEPEPMDVDAKAAEALQFEQLEAVRHVQLITRNEYPLEHLQRAQLLSRDFDDDDDDDDSGAGVCYCSYPDATDTEKKRCDDVSCLNFATYVECGANCPAREHCRNQRLQHPELFPKLEAFKTEKKGFGVRTTEDIAQSRIIGEYVGEIIDQKELALRLKSAPRNELNFYYLLLEPGIYIDARTKGSFTRFVNHSCEPNCKTEKWTVKGETRIAVIALRDISKSEELTFDYQWKSLGSRQIKCFCESANCKGVIGTESDAAKSDEPNGVFREPEKSEVGAAIVDRRIRIFKSPDDHSQYYIATIKHFDEKDEVYEVDYQDTIDVDAEFDEDDGFDDSPEEKKGERFVRLSEMDWQIFVELDGMSDAQIEKAVFSIPKKRVSDQTESREPSPKAPENGAVSSRLSREPSPSSSAAQTAPFLSGRTISNVPAAAKRNLDGELVDGEGNVITNKLLVKGISVKCDLATVRKLFVVDDRRHRSSAGSQHVVTDLEMFFFDDDSGWALVEFTDTKYASIFKRKLNARPLEGKDLRVFHAGRKEVENFHRAKRNFALRRLHNNAKPSGESAEKTTDTPKTIVPYCFGRKLNWQVSVEQMEDSPSRRLGVSPSLEQKLRVKCVKLIQRLMKKLHLDREDATSAVIALNRYLTFHAMNVSKVEHLAAAIFHLFLRAHARKFSWVAFVSEVHAAKTSSSSVEATKQLDDKSDEFKAVERQLLSVEKEILEGLRYDLSSEDPYAMLESLISGLARPAQETHEVGTTQQQQPPADVLREARQLVSDALRLPIWVQTPVACIVLSILYVSAAVTHALKEHPSTSSKEEPSTAAAIPAYLPVLDGRRNELESLMLLECALSLCDNLKERWARLEKIAKATRKASQSEDVFDTEQFAVVREKPVEISQRISDLLKAWINIPASGLSSRVPSPSPEGDLSSRKSEEFITLSMIDKSLFSMRIADRRNVSSRTVSPGNDETEIVAAARVVPKQVAKGPGGGSTTILSSADRLQTSGITGVEVIRKRVLLGTIAEDLPFDVAGKKVFLQPWPNRDHAPAFSKDGSISKSCVRELSAAISLNNKYPSGFLKLYGVVFPEEKKPQPSAKLPGALSESKTKDEEGLDVDMLELSDTTGSSTLSSSLNRLDSSMHYLAFEQPLHMYAGIFEAKLRVPMQLKKKVIFDMLQSLSACHEHSFVHRFVAPTHLFLFKNGAKLGGFHAIRKATPSKVRDSSNPVYEMSESERKELCAGSWVTVSAPEILLGDCNFSWRCDIWSAGCVALAILLDNVALLLGADSKMQIDKIFRMCGTPSVEFEGAMKLPLYKQFRPKGEYKKRLRKTLTENCAEKKTELPDEALVLLEGMLQLDPANRKSAKELLELDFFREVAGSLSDDAFDFTTLPETYPIQQKRMLAQLKAGKYKRRRPTNEASSSASGSHRSSRHHHHHHHRKSDSDSRSDSRSRTSSSNRGAEVDVAMGDDVPLPEFFNFSADPSAVSSSKGLLSPVRSSRPEKRAKLGWGMGLHSDNAN